MKRPITDTQTLRPFLKRNPVFTRVVALITLPFVPVIITVWYVIKSLPEIRSEFLDVFSIAFGKWED